MKSKSAKNTDSAVYSSTEMKRYLGVLSETHNEHLKAINENFVIVNKKLDEHTRILDEHTRILGDHENKLDSLSSKLDSHTEMIGTLMEDVSAIRLDLKRKVDYDEFLSLVKRVQKLETKN